MLCNFWLDLHFIFTNVTTLCSCRKIVPSGVSLLFRLLVQSRLHFQCFWDLLCRFTSVESTKHTRVMMKLLQKILDGLDRGLSLVPVLCHKLQISKVLDAQQVICVGNPVGLLKGLKESPRKLEQSHAHVLSSPYHSIWSSGYMACWIKPRQDIEASSPRAGWMCRSWNVVRGRMFPSSSNA